MLTLELMLERVLVPVLWSTMTVEKWHKQSVLSRRIHTHNPHTHTHTSMCKPKYKHAFKHFKCEQIFSTVKKKQRTQGTTFHQHAISCGKKSRARNEKCESDTKSVERARRVARKPKCNLARKKVWTICTPLTVHAINLLLHLTFYLKLNAIPPYIRSWRCTKAKNENQTILL